MRGRRHRRGAWEPVENRDAEPTEAERRMAEHAITEWGAAELPGRTGASARRRSSRIAHPAVRDALRAGAEELPDIPEKSW